jgi:hypothetical protein
MRLLKNLHGWLGVVVLPWVLIIGLTGLFLNHQRLVLGLLNGDSYDEAQFDAWPNPTALSPEDAHALATRLFPGQDIAPAESRTYHGRAAAVFDLAGTELIVALQTGHYWLKTDYRRVTYAPDGAQLETKIYWDAIFKRLHERGWLTNQFGSWLADITAAAMVLFGLSGIVLFLMPRLRRSQNRRRMRRAG